LEKKFFKEKIKKAKIIKIIVELKDKNYIKKLKLKNIFSGIKIVSYDEKKAEINKKM
jgi:hypothetical protein